MIRQKHYNKSTMLLRFQWNYFFIFLIAVLPQLIFFQGHAGTICSMTFNSKEEIELFKKYHSQNNEFVELLDFDILDRRKNNSSANSVFQEINKKHKTEAWLEMACHQPVTCDTLVISGHFAGQFFGEEKDQELYLETMEKLSCSSECQPLFQNVKKVFLFGCNTLAGKQKDKRLPKDYFMALIDEHGFKVKEADASVAARYSPIGGSIYNRIRNVFPNAIEIYGFSSKAPSGSDIESKLSGFVKEYDLNARQGELFISKLKGFPADYISDAIPQSNSVNSKLNSTFANGLNEISVTNKIALSCQIHDVNNSFKNRLNLLLKQIEIDLSQPNPSLKLAHHEEMLSLIQQAKLNLSEQEFKTTILQEIQKNSNLKELKNIYFEAFKNLNYTPYTKFKLFSFFVDMNWISKQNLSSVFENNILQWMNEISPINEYQSLAFCLAISEIPLFKKIKVHLNPDTFNIDWNNPFNWKVLSCANNTDEDYYQLLFEQIRNPIMRDHAIGALLISSSKSLFLDNKLWLQTEAIKDLKVMASLLNSFRMNDYPSAGFVNFAYNILSDPNYDDLMKEKVAKLLKTQSQLTSSGKQMFVDLLKDNSKAEPDPSSRSNSLNPISQWKFWLEYSLQELNKRN